MQKAFQAQRLVKINNFPSFKTRNIRIQKKASSVDIFEKIDKFDVIACVPAYKESVDELLKTVNSFEEIATKLRIHVVFIVDGIAETGKHLKSILNMDEAEEYEQFEGYKFLQSSILCSSHSKPIQSLTKKIKTTLIIKDENKGKRDSQVLFLSLLKNSITKQSQRLFLSLDCKPTISAMLNKLKLNIFLLDSDTSFDPNALDQLYKSLWDYPNSSVCGVAGMTVPREDAKNIVVLSQNYEYLVTESFFTKAPNSVIGTVLCLHGAFSMYKASDLMQPYVLESYGRDQNLVQNIYEKVKLSVGEDRYLTTILLRSGQRTIFEHRAKSYTSPPSSFASLLLQRKRWNNSILANSIELLLKPIKINSRFDAVNIKFMRFNVLVDFLCSFLVPALSLQCYYSILSLFFNKNFISPLNFAFSSLLLFLALTFVSIKLKANKHPKLYNIIAGLLCFVWTVPVAIVSCFVLNLFFKFTYWEYSIDQLLMCFLPFIMTCCVAIRFKILDRMFFLSFFSNYIVSPLYTLMIPVYAFANFDDVSWHGVCTSKKMDSQNTTKINLARLVKKRQFAIFLGVNILFLSLNMFESLRVMNWFVLFFISLIFIPRFILSISYQIFGYHKKKNQ